MSRTTSIVRFALLAGGAVSALSAAAGELPKGGRVVHGGAAIDASADRMTIRQSSGKAIVHWGSFSIGEGARVDIVQPSSKSSMLNRVTGDTPSTIAGRLDANGRVFLVNPNGVAITRTGVVRTGAFAASTLDLKDADFKAGRLRFSGNGRSAAVSNAGVIEIGRGGFAALLGGKIDNSGVVSVPLGRVALGAGEQAALDLSGDGFLQVGVPSDSAGDSALIASSGRVTADGGRVEIRAATARDAARRAVNLSGVIEARSVGGRSGAIVLGGGEGGEVSISGKLDASAGRAIGLPAFAGSPAPRPKVGGTVTVTGAQITLAGAVVDASGVDGGGRISIGGEWQGGGDLQRAAVTTVDATTALQADATGVGDGGRIVIWSDRLTTFAGRISARGGPGGGDGGDAEVSGKARLAYSGHADLSAAAGDFGTLLLDPFDIFIEDGDTVGFGDGEDAFVAGAESSVLNAGDLEEALLAADVTVQSGAGGDQDGDITVGSELAWGDDSLPGGVLTLAAQGDIIIAAPIIAEGAGLTLTTPGQITTPDSWLDSAGALQEDGNGEINIGAFTLEAGDWIQNSPDLPGFSAGNFQIPGGSFLRAAGGTGTAADPFQIVDVFGLQSVGSGGAAALTASYALANDIEAAGAADWDVVEGPQGFDPIGVTEGDGIDVPLEDVPFEGTFDGAGFVIDGLFVRPRDFGEGAGLFSALGPTAVVENLGLTGVDVAGGARAGALAGGNAGTVRQVFSTGAVSGEQFVGGLVGQNSGAVENAFSEATVVQTNDFQILAGGLVGQNLGAIVDSYARGAVDGSFGIFGGLVGENFGAIERAYSTATLPAPDEGSLIGGLVGSATGDGAAGTTSESFWDVTVSGVDASEGGLGLTTAELQDTEAFIARPDNQGWNFETTWAPPGGGGYPALYAMEPVVWVDVDDLPSTYGEDDREFTSTLTGGVEDYLFGPPNDAFAPDIGFATTAAADSPVGDYAVAAVLPDDPVSEGGVSFRLVTTDGVLSVGQAPLVVTANDAPKSYGAANPEFTASFTGFVLGEGVGDLGGALAFATLADAASDVGDYAVDPLGLTSGNYAIDFEPGTLTVNPAPLTVTVEDARRRYGAANPNFTVEYDGFVLEQGPDVLGGTLRFETDAVESSAVGGYRVDATGLTSDNYAIDPGPGTLTIDRAPLTVTVEDARRRYGAANPDFIADYDGFVLEQDPGVLDGTLRFETAATVSSDVGSYRVDATGLTSDNYAIDFDPGTLTVGRAPLIVTVEDARRRYGAANPAFTADYDGFVLGQDPGVLAGTLRFEAGADASSNVGTYVVSASGQTSDNYALAYEPGRLSVTPAPLRIIAQDQTKPAGTELNFVGTEFLTRGLRNRDRVRSVTLESAGAAAAALALGSPYAITPSDAVGRGLVVDGVANYDITYVDGALTFTEGAAPAPAPPPPASRIPQTQFELVSPADTITVVRNGSAGFAVAAGGGPTLGAPRRALPAAEDALALVVRLSDELEADVAACETSEDTFEARLACLSAALAQYAAGLEASVVDLPEPLRAVSAVIEQASRRIDTARATAASRLATARTPEEVDAIQSAAVAESRAAVDAAVVEIRKAIDLIRAEEPQVARLEVEQGVVIAAALQSVNVGLVNALGL